LDSNALEVIIGIGDDIMATGFARGAQARGARIAFGDGQKILWGPFSEIAFRHNPNIARLTTETGIEWIHYHKGNRLYNKLGDGRWIWNYRFRPIPGEFFFTKSEREHTVARQVLIEPNVPWQKSVAPNKDWGLEKYQELADRLMAVGINVWQMSVGTKRLRNVQVMQIPDFRCAAAMLAGIELLICPEGGLHHAAAAVGTKAIVIFGGFIPPQVTGYDNHVNLTGGVEACGSLRECSHCRDAMRRIDVEAVACKAIGLLDGN
jgi:hypothetical protein